MAVTLNQTTLAAAVGANDDRINLASAGTVAPGQMVYIDREAMLLLALMANTTTIFFVQRGYSGTAAVPHISGAKVYTGPQSYFYMTNPSGAAVATNEVALPHVNVLSGDVFDINAGAWRQVGTGGVVQGTAVWP
jgi:hypothetical protein